MELVMSECKNIDRVKWFMCLEMPSCSIVKYLWANKYADHVFTPKISCMLH